MFMIILVHSPDSNINVSPDLAHIWYYVAVWECTNQFQQIQLFILKMYW